MICIFLLLLLDIFIVIIRKFNSNFTLGIEHTGMAAQDRHDTAIVL